MAKIYICERCSPLGEKLRKHLKERRPDDKVRLTGCMDVCAKGQITVRFGKHGDTFTVADSLPEAEEQVLSELEKR